LKSTPIEGVIKSKGIRLDISDVAIKKRAKDDLTKIPQYVAKKLLAWVDDVNFPD
jgi:hypothetical protein